MGTQVTVEEVELGGRVVRFEAGEVAGRAGGAVVVRSGAAMVLATIVAEAGPARKAASEDGLDFVPLTVEYRERASAVGRFPGGHGRREARLGDHEILMSRLLDRTLRPLIPSSWNAETQVLVTVFGAEAKSDLTTLSLLAAAAALHVSDVPAAGPAAGLRVGRGKGGALVFAPGEGASDEEWIVSASREGIVMAEGGAEEVPGEVVISVFEAATGTLEPVWAAIERLRVAVGKAKRPAPGATVDAAREATRASIAGGRREDGRAVDEVRAIDAKVGYLPSNHGSALFTRGGTQALVSVTLASDEPAVFDSLLAKRSDRFFLHYNFPPFSVGEVRAQRGPGRREVGHGALAQRALSPVIPAQDELPFSIRVVSDILESDGSSSMATVCGASLALMDAGVPVSGAVAGIAMGVVIGAGGATIVSDIRGVEDAHGDMDLKVAGTRKGLTAIQLDQKVGAVPLAVIAQALGQARVGLDHILDRMAEVLAEPRDKVAPHAPQVLRMKIPQSRIGLVIGQGGKTISELQSATQTRIDVKDDGRVKIAARRAQDAQAALARIEAIVQELTVGKVYTAEVVTIKEYGAFVRIGDHEGLVHVSELAATRVDKVEDVVRVGDSVQVKVIGADKRGRLELSRKAAL